MADSLSFAGRKPGRLDLTLLSLFPIVVTRHRRAIAIMQFQSGIGQRIGNAYSPNDGPNRAHDRFRYSRTVAPQ